MDVILIITEKLHTFGIIDPMPKWLPCSIELKRYRIFTPQKRTEIKLIFVYFGGWWHVQCNTKGKYSIAQQTPLYTSGKR